VETTSIEPTHLTTLVISDDIQRALPPGAVAKVDRLSITATTAVYDCFEVIVKGRTSSAEFSGKVYISTPNPLICYFLLYEC
jgi:hypothetical protein